MAKRECNHDSESPNGSIVYVRINGRLAWAVCRWCGRRVGKILNG